MSPAPYRSSISQAAAKALTRMAALAGADVRDERLRRGMSLRDEATRAGVSAAAVQKLESGAHVSLETYARIATALDLRPELHAMDPRKRLGTPARDQDFVHAAMGELEATRLRSFGFGMAMDEPYQHYQFAGRADLVAWDVERSALLHVENRTRFPDIQSAFGSYAGKRAYLADVLARRMGEPGHRWASETHVMIALWSAEVLHALRIRTESFRAACPDPPDDAIGWWNGAVPSRRGRTCSLLILDPAPNLTDARRFASLSDLDRIRPRYRGYADAAERLRR
jgi:transcriptional regulator with XRE-family HTH domain